MCHCVLALPRGMLPLYVLLLYAVMVPVYAQQTFTLDGTPHTVTWASTTRDWVLDTQSRNSDAWHEVLRSNGATSGTGVPLALEPGVCTACAQGTFAGALGSTTCARCAPGTFAGVLSSTACTACGPGEHSPYGAAACFDLASFLAGSGCTCAREDVAR